MTLPVWPAAIPLPTLSGAGYTITPQEGVTRTDMEIGPARARKRSTATPWRLKLRWHLMRFELTLFEAWYRSYADEGAAYFSMTLISGVGLETHQIRFFKSYESVAQSGELWLVTAEVESRDPPWLDAGGLDTLLDTPDFAALLAEATAWEAFVPTFPHAPYFYAWS